MNITKVYITLQEKGKQLAYASITLDNEFVVSGLKVLDGKNGLWVSMPNYKKANGEYQDIAYPVTKEAREQIQQAVLSKFHEAQGKEEYKPTQEQKEYQQTYDKYEEKKRYEQIDVTEDELPF